MNYSVAKLDPFIPSCRRFSCVQFTKLGLPACGDDIVRQNFRAQIWCRQNRETDRQSKREWRERNLEKCRESQRQYKRRNPEKTRQIGRIYVARQQKIKREFVDSLKLSTPCKDCSLFFPPCCMDYDHLPGTEKIASVSLMAANCMYKIPDIQNEMSKCELVCANCHRIRTHKRRTYARKP